jgi:hypothetical protein
MKLTKVLFLWSLIYCGAAQVHANTLTTLQDRDSSVAGTYKAILYHEGTKFYQFANILLRTIQVGGGQLKISANVKVYFGDWNSNEFLTYEFDDCPMNLLTRQISIKSEKNNISMIGILKAGTRGRVVLNGSGTSREIYRC